MSPIQPATSVRQYVLVRPWFNITIRRSTSAAQAAIDCEWHRRSAHCRPSAPLSHMPGLRPAEMVALRRAARADPDFGRDRWRGWGIEESARKAAVWYVTTNNHSAGA
jgi:hypothetical protein